MTKLSKASSKPRSSPNRTTIEVRATSDAEAKRKVAALYLTPAVNAARVTMAYTPKGSLDLVEVVAELKAQQAVVAAGDMAQVEAMLLNQATALQAMFTDLAERGKGQTGLAQIQCLLGLALRAQGQCRATLQTLAEVKFPRAPTFIRQANIAGQQQVNNGTAEARTAQYAGARAGSSGVSSNEVLEDRRDDTDRNRVDGGAARTSGDHDSRLEAVGAVHGTTDERRNRAEFAERP
jgi:hypothetical protein